MFPLLHTVGVPFHVRTLGAGAGSRFHSMEARLESKILGRMDDLLCS